MLDTQIYIIRQRNVLLRREIIMHCVIYSIWKTRIFR